MKPNDLTHAQIWNALQQTLKRLVRLENAVRNAVHFSLSYSASASSGATSGTGGIASQSASWSGDLEDSISGDVAITSGTGSATFNMPAGKAI